MDVGHMTIRLKVLTDENIWNESHGRNSDEVTYLQINLINGVFQSVWIILFIILVIIVICNTTMNQEVEPYSCCSNSKSQERLKPTTRQNEMWGNWGLLVPYLLDAMRSERSCPASPSSSSSSSSSPSSTSLSSHIPLESERNNSWWCKYLPTGTRRKEEIPQKICYL